jgi:hypothetical protein
MGVRFGPVIWQIDIRGRNDRFSFGPAEILGNESARPLTGFFIHSFFKAIFLIAKVIYLRLLSA